MSYLRRLGARAEVYKAFSLEQLASHDIIIAQRQYDPNIYKMLMELQWKGKTVIYEIDDDVHAIEPRSAVFDVYKPGGHVLKMVTKFLETVDGLTTSCEYLAGQYSQFCKKTWVISNYIDCAVDGLEGIRDWDTPVERDPRLRDKVVIGWGGSITHQDDARCIGDAVTRVLEKYPQTILALVSAYSTMENFIQDLKVPEDRVVRLDPVPFDDYPKLPAQFDIGLIPLANNTFNRAKSSLKPLEYWARGVPYIASNIAPYLKLHTETKGQGGFIVNSSREWEERLSQLVEDENLRRQMSEFGHRIVREEYAMGKNIWRWAEAYKEARAMKFFQPEAERKYELLKKPSRNDACPCGSGSKYKRCCIPAWG